MRNFHRIIVPLSSLACRLILAIIFFYAGIEKIADPEEFAVAIYNYQLLPDIAVNALAVILPWLEIIIATCLVTGFYVRSAALISSALFLTFATALTINLLRVLRSGFRKHKLALSGTRPVSSIHVNYYHDL